jgi:hypothetical protein
MTAEPPPEAREVLSPELVLVSSPEDAQRAREQLAEPLGDGVAESTAPLSAGPVAVSPAAATERPPPPPYPRFELEDVLPEPARGWRRSRTGLTVGFLGALVLGIGYFTETRWDGGTTTNDAAARSATRVVTFSMSVVATHPVPTARQQRATPSTGAADKRSARTIRSKLIPPPRPARAQRFTPVTTKAPPTTTALPATTRAAPTTSATRAPKAPTVKSPPTPKVPPKATARVPSTPAKPLTTVADVENDRTVKSKPTAHPRPQPPPPQPQPQPQPLTASTTLTDAQKRPTAKQPPHPPPPEKVIGFVPTRTWVWSPQQGADGYDVTFLLNGHVVFHARPTKPILVLPSGFRFRAGLYRWTVLSSPPAATAKPIVDSTFRLTEATAAEANRT